MGEIVYKARKPGDSSYNLPDRYKANGGDLLDYYHVGVVTKVRPLEITHCSTMKWSDPSILLLCRMPQ